MKAELAEAAESSAHCLDLLGQTALVAGCLVGMHDVLARYPVDDRNGLAVRGFGFRLVSALDGFAHPLDVGADHGAIAGVVLAQPGVLPGPLFR